MLLSESNPIRLEGFTLRPDGAIPVGRPSRDKVEAALTFAASMQQSSGYWIGDILRYCEDRADLSGVIEEIMSVTGLARQTLYNKLYVARRVAPATRHLAPSEAHAAQVAALAPEAQTTLLTRASDEGWTVYELKQHVRVATRPAVLEGRARLSGRYRVILADPPWAYRQNNPTVDGSLRKADQAYPTMSIEALCALPVAQHTEPDAVLFLWATAPLLLQNPGPRDVLEAWGFAYKSNRVWDKVIGMPGSYGMQVKHEHLIIAVKGRCLPDVPTPHDDSVEVIRREGAHSAKPEAFRAWILRHWTAGPYLELFGRQPVEGWSVFGNDARLWKDGTA